MKKWTNYEKQLYPLCIISQNEILYTENLCKNENNEEVEKYMGNIYIILKAKVR